jgi:hypothetical protein
MQATTFLSLIPSVITCLSIPFDFLSKSQIFRCTKSLDKRHNPNLLMATQQGSAAYGLAGPWLGALAVGPGLPAQAVPSMSL